jgi:hypothetical protein
MEAFVVITPSGRMDTETLAFSKEESQRLFCVGRVAGQDCLGNLQSFNLDHYERGSLWRMYETRGYAIQQLEINEPEPVEK